MIEHIKPVIFQMSLVQDQQNSNIFSLNSAIVAAMSWLTLKHPPQGSIYTPTEHEKGHEREESY